MTDLQKEQILEMRSRGCGCTQIAAELGISRNTVKSYCRRHKAHVCLRCGKPVSARAKFCSAACRAAWWREHNKKTYPRTVYRLVCRNCGAVFESPGDRRRKYCSHACYIADRFGKKDGVL